MMRSGAGFRWLFWALVLLFVGIRLAILTSAQDLLGHLGEGEVGHADLAWALLHDQPLRPLLSYQVVSFHGGTLISSLLEVPFAAVFGPTLFSLKLLALSYALVALLSWSAVIARLAGPGSACLFALISCFAPPVLLRMQLTLWGTHAELNALLGLLLLTLVRALDARGHPHAVRAAALFGFLAGCSIYFNYSALVAVGLCLMIWVLATRGDRAGLLPVGLGTIAGFSPFFGALRSHTGTLQVYGQSSQSLLEGASERLTSLPSLILRTPPFSPQLEAHASPELTFFGGVLHLGLYGLAAWMGARALRTLLWRRTDPAPPDGHVTGDTSASLMAVIGLYPFVFMGVFASIHLPFTTSTAGTFGFCPRYAATLYPFLTAAVALAASPLLSRPGRRVGPAVSALLAIALLGPALLELPALMSLSTPTTGLHFDGVRYKQAGLWGVDRRSMSGVDAFLEAEARGQVSSQEASGVRAVLGEVWFSDYWRFLRRPPVGPTPEEVDARARNALEGQTDAGFIRGVDWGKSLALGQGWKGPAGGSTGSR